MSEFLSNLAYKTCVLLLFVVFLPIILVAIGTTWFLICLVLLIKESICIAIRIISGTDNMASDRKKCLTYYVWEDYK